ncbi:TetR/AcrR family transcriptional regulator C-terminal domain-containing protein [Streptomyces sp. NPDC001123]
MARGGSRAVDLFVRTPGECRWRRTAQAGRRGGARRGRPGHRRLARTAMADSTRRPEFTARAHTSTWPHRMQAITELLGDHAAKGTVDDLEIAAEQSLAIIGALPVRLGIRRHPRDPGAQERPTRDAEPLPCRGCGCRRD